MQPGLSALGEQVDDGDDGYDDDGDNSGSSEGDDEDYTQLDNFFDADRYRSTAQR